MSNLIQTYCDPLKKSYFSKNRKTEPNAENMISIENIIFILKSDHYFKTVMRTG